jgi:hypothetical protein
MHGWPQGSGRVVGSGREVWRGAGEGGKGCTPAGAGPGGSCGRAALVSSWRLRASSSSLARSSAITCRLSSRTCASLSSSFACFGNTHAHTSSPPARVDGLPSSHG